MVRRRNRSRRGLAYLGLALVAGAFTIYKAVGAGSGGGGSSDQREPVASPRVAAGGTAGNQRGGDGLTSRGGSSAGKAAPPAGLRSPGGARKTPARRADNLTPKTGRKGTEQVLEPAADGTFRLKVGQVEVEASDSLDFSTEDAVPGLLWLPIGLHEVATGDPWVTMCLIDYQHYQESPASTPMFAHLNSYSKCGIKRKADDESIAAGMVAVLRMSSLQKTIKEQGMSSIPPRGFVYHETRCGSTLVANMLASLPPSRVFSESKPPTQSIRECTADGCDSQTITKVFRDVVGLMGRRRSNELHEHLYFKFQNSKFLPQISEAYPEVPWVFVFRDPVEVMVSNLKSLAGAPCVRIPRQEKARLAAKLGGAGPRGPPRGPKGRKGVGGGGGGGGRGNSGSGDYGASGRVRQRLDAVRRERDDERGAPGLGGGRGRRGLSATGGGWGDWMADTTAEEGSVYPLTDSESGVVAFWDGEEDEGEGEGDDDLFGGGTWDSFTSGGSDSLVTPSWPASLESSVAAQQDRRILLTSKRSPQKLTMNMTMECADWLKAMCMSAIVAEKNSPSNALFVDYSNLPDAVPEFVFPQHFGMEAEVSKTVPEWKDIMMEAAGVYSKGLGGRAKIKQFTNDVEAKHKSASPLIVEASELDGGLYEVYRSLDALQSWRRPEPGE
eukprot:g14788.t1